MRFLVGTIWEQNKINQHLPFLPFLPRATNRANTTSHPERACTRWARPRRSSCPSWCNRTPNWDRQSAKTKTVSVTKQMKRPMLSTNPNSPFGQRVFVHVRIGVGILLLQLGVGGLGHAPLVPLLEQAGQAGQGRAGRFAHWRQTASVCY